MALRSTVFAKRGAIKQHLELLFEKTVVELILMEPQLYWL